MAHTPYHSTNYLDMIQIQIVMLQAKFNRLKERLASPGQDVHTELAITSAQLAALNTEYNRVEAELR